jgi:hypothetical protein
MLRIQLLINIDPGSAECVINFRRSDGTPYRTMGFIDTGAEVSLFPKSLLEKIDHRLSPRGKIEVEQAGIAHQVFSAVEAFIPLFLEDATGNQTSEFEARGWFTDTDVILIGFDGILDRATLYIDMRQTRSGWLEFDD